VEERKSRGTSIFPQDLSELDDFLFEAYNRLTGNSTYHAYLRKRKIDDCIRRCRIGFWDGWYTFPAYNKQREVIGALGRAGPILEAYSEQRFTQPYGQRPLLYVPDWKLWDSEDTLFVTFGFIDAVSMTKLGYAACSPTAGKESTYPEWFDGVKKDIIVIPDKGERKTAWELASQLGFRGDVFIPDYPDGTKDINEYLVKDEEALCHELRKQCS
jgi:hypothetical protein